MVENTLKQNSSHGNLAKTQIINSTSFLLVIDWPNGLPKFVGSTVFEIMGGGGGESAS